MPRLLPLLALLAACKAEGDSSEPPSDEDGDGYLSNEDCQDGDPEIHPGAAERCNGKDDDCDGVIDGSSAVDKGTWYPDADADGFGWPYYPREGCEAPEGYVANGEDCDDTDYRVSPEGKERCDGLDDDCDGMVDVDAVDASTWYEDADGDGFGNPDSVEHLCEGPEGWVGNRTDCDDEDPAVNPLGTDSWYDGIDTDCDGASDFDADGDGYDSDAWGGEDCDDTEPKIRPGAKELCNEQDDDCDLEVDEAGAIGESTWWPDVDEDGYGDAEDPGTLSCTQLEGQVDNDLDCEDADPTVSPDATEIWYDGVDSDCDGWSDWDADGDGYDSELYGGGDCDDTDASVLPQTWYPDEDGDGYGDSSTTLYACLQPSGTVAVDGDCLDTDSAVNPDATEVCGNGVDDDCDESAVGCGPIGTLSLVDATATITGVAKGDRLGESFANGGDTNGDGWEELWVGAPGDPSISSTKGAAWLFAGPLSTSDTADALSLARLDGEQSKDRAGYSVAGAGDLDGDGYDDLAVGAWANDNAATSGGAVYVAMGPFSGHTSLADGAGIWEGSSNYNYLGRSLSGGRDLDGDGLPDLATGTYRPNATGAVQAGAVYLLFGPATPGGSIDDADVLIQGSEPYEYAGDAIDIQGDSDGDGQADLVVGSRGKDATGSGSGAIYLFLGPLLSDTETDQADASAAGEAAADAYGTDVHFAGDVDGDGYDDLLVGAPGSDQGGTDSGAAWLLYGPLEGDVGATGSGRSLLMVGESASDAAGQGLASGDLNADDSPDLVVGAPDHAEGSSQVGASYVIFGPLTGTLDLADADGRILGKTSGGEVGATALADLDLDQDGLDDLLVGAPGLASGSKSAAGVALLFPGGAGY